MFCLTQESLPRGSNSVLFPFYFGRADADICERSAAIFIDALPAGSNVTYMPSSDRMRWHSQQQQQQWRPVDGQDVCTRRTQSNQIYAESVPPGAEWPSVPVAPGLNTSEDVGSPVLTLSAAVCLALRARLLHSGWETVTLTIIPTDLWPFELKICIPVTQWKRPRHLLALLCSAYVIHWHCRVDKKGKRKAERNVSNQQCA